jgi:hypothetical protein
VTKSPHVYATSIPIGNMDVDENNSVPSSVLGNHSNTTPKAIQDIKEAPENGFVNKNLEYDLMIIVQHIDCVSNNPQSMAIVIFLIAASLVSLTH